MGCPSFYAYRYVRFSSSLTGGRIAFELPAPLDADANMIPRAIATGRFSRAHILTLDRCGIYICCKTHMYSTTAAILRAVSETQVNTLSDRYLDTRDVETNTRCSKETRTLSREHASSILAGECSRYHKRLLCCGGAPNRVSPAYFDLTSSAVLSVRCNAHLYTHHPYFRRSPFSVRICERLPPLVSPSLVTRRVRDHQGSSYGDPHSRSTRTPLREIP
jgi:hypothetical protein